MFEAYKIKDPGEGWIAVILPGKGGLKEGKGSGRQNSVRIREALLWGQENKSLVTAEVKTKVRQSCQVQHDIWEPVGGREEGMGPLGRTTLGRTTVNTDENCRNCKFTEGWEREPREVQG